MYARTLTALLLCLACGSGCAALRIGRFASEPPPPLENPFFVPAIDREMLWCQLVDAVDDYFRIEREDRVRVIGGILTEGRIDTFPTVGSTLLEPWRRDSTRGYEKLHATLQSIRRRATVRVIPTEGGYLIDVTVQKELEDLDRPEHATAGGATLRYDATLVRQEAAAGRYSITPGWIVIGRDASLEQQILRDLCGRLNLTGGVLQAPAVEEVQLPVESGPLLSPAQPAETLPQIPEAWPRMPETLPPPRIER